MLVLIDIPDDIIRTEDDLESLCRGLDAAIHDSDGDTADRCYETNCRLIAALEGGRVVHPPTNEE